MIATLRAFRRRTARLLAPVPALLAGMGFVVLGTASPSAARADGVVTALGAAVASGTVAVVPAPGLPAVPGFVPGPRTASSGGTGPFGASPSGAPGVVLAADTPSAAPISRMLPVVAAAVAGARTRSALARAGRHGAPSTAPPTAPF